VARDGPAPALSDSAFAALSSSLSAEGGYFDTDNLISNEASYLHVLGPLRERGVRGGVYVGVGPDQNFSYMAEVRPRMAFVVDIRRDNLLHQLLFKALFEAAPTRAEYLSLLFGRSLPERPEAWHDAGVEELLRRVDERPGSDETRARAAAAVDSLLSTFGFALDASARETIVRFHREFMIAGPDLRFRSFGRAPRPYYPTLRQLLGERDLTGRRVSYLADRERYLYVRELQTRNLVVPVVGDLAGDRALPALAEWLEERGEAVTLLYTSNVEFYLFRDGTFGRFARNVQGLPRAPGAVLVRSYFPSFRGRHPHAVEGYWSTQTLQTLDSFVQTVEGGGFPGYWELVTRDAVDPRPGGDPW
jgi:hypothetical protein